MINKLIEFSVNNRLFVFFATIILLSTGIKSFQELPVDAVPDITNTQVQINTATKGLIPEEIERMVTFPVEYSMNGIPGVENIRSTSRYGVSQVTVIFKDGFNIYKARQLVSEKLQSLDLPEEIKPNMGPISTGLGEIVHYSIEAKNVEKDPRKRLTQLMNLRSLQDWFIKPRLLSVKGVTEVNTIGGHEKQFFIQPNIEYMAKNGIHFDDIEAAIKKTNLNVGGGYIQQTGEQLLVRGVGLLKGIADIENVVVKRLTNLNVIRIKDIATVKFEKQLRTGAGTVNGEESIVGTVFMLLGENSRAVSNRAVIRLEEVKKDLPNWVDLRVLHSRSSMVNKTLNTVSHNLLLGAALVFIFLMLLIGNITAAIITAITIPIALLTTFILMKWQNISGNLMSLGALDFGIIVDGAVIVIENCVRKIQLKRKNLGRALSRLEVREVVKNATIEIRKAAGFGQLIVLVVFIPIFALSGVEGKMFRPVAMTFIMALASAAVISFTIVPSLAATFLSGNIKEGSPVLMRMANFLFKPSLSFALKFKRAFFSLGIVSILMGAFLFSKMGSEFIPKLDEGDFAIQFIRPANINTQSSILLQRKSENIIKSFPQVKLVFSRIGTGEVATDVMGVNLSDTYIILKDIKKWPGNMGIDSKKELISRIREKIELYVPGQVAMFTQPVELRFNELLEGTKSVVSAKVYGDDLDKLIHYSKELAEIIGKVRGAGEVESESKGKSPMLQYIPKNKELAQLGVTSRPVLDAINTAIGGRKVGDIYDGVKRFPIITRLSEEKRKDVLTIRKLPVGVAEGHTVPIEKVAKISFVDTFSNISRENSQRRVAVLINPETRDIESFVKRAKKLVDEKLRLAEGYYIEWGGSFKNLQSAKKKLALLVPLALIIIIAMLYAAFNNIVQVLLIFLCAPMALIGGVLALKIMGLPFSISAGVGFIALSGISILNGVVLVSYFNQLSASGLDPDDVVRQGTMTRLRPVLMTGLTDVFGFLPMVFSTGLGAEVQRPLATVVVGGIFSATILTLLVLPGLYRLFFKRMNPG